MKCLSLSPLVLFLPACLENEEEIEVRPDGSVTVTLSSEGEVPDLADGYPVPLDPRWRLASSDAERWAREVGSDTGSAEARARASRAVWPRQDERHDPEAHLVVEGTFTSVDELPRWFAPESEAYRSAYLARSTSLAIEERAGGRVFVFERTFHGFDRARLDPVGEDDLPEELEQKFREEEELTEDEWHTVIQVVTDGYDRVAEALARDAVLGVFTASGSAPSPRALAAMLDEVRAAAGAVLSNERLGRLAELVREEDEAAGKALEELERDWRAALRTALGTALARAGVASEATNAALYALEWQLTAFDHFGDLADETFVVSLTLPGTLIAGNFQELEDGVARWGFEGKDLDGKDVVLRAVSVLE